MPDIVLLSYTPLDSPGGVPRWCRDFIAGFPGTRHYSWWDCAQANGIDPDSQYIPEWEKAKLLTRFLKARGHIGINDIVIGDNWWVDGLETRERTISVAHGNWSHTTLEDVQAGIPPEFPAHAYQQLAWRKRYTEAGRKIVTVSDFIGYEMKRQWGFESTVINNGIDLEKFKPLPVPRSKLKNDTYVQDRRPLIIHFTTTANKGLDHIEAIKKSVDADVWLLDEAADKMQMQKYKTLAAADLVVHPSVHEGNSYAILETLACDVPVVAYGVGLLWKFQQQQVPVGYLHWRDKGKDIDSFVTSVKCALDGLKLGEKFICRENIKLGYTIQHFHDAWRKYLNDEFGYQVRV